MEPVIMAAMANYNKDRGYRSGGANRNFGKPRFNNDRQEMYSATCANCGKQCEVPFRPTGNKPVLCRECFQNSRDSDSRRPEQRSFDRPSFNRDENRSCAHDCKAQFDMLNAKMDKILELLTQRPKKAAPVESALNEQVIGEIAKEVQEEKPKKTKSATKTGK